jgi:hypothetical protein
MQLPLPYKFEMCAQLDLEVRCERPQKNKKKTKKKPYNFRLFRSEEVHSKKHLEKKIVRFKCNNLLDPMESGAETF